LCAERFDELQRKITLDMLFQVPGEEPRPRRA
jgi:hypothetical protein